MDVEDWIRAHVEPTGAIEVEKERPWATTLRVPTADGPVWFKAAGGVQLFEPRLTAQLAARWPDRVTEVIAHDEERAWLLMGDAGTAIGVYGNPPEAWEQILPRYAELQIGETAHAADHLAHEVPDRTLAQLPELYDDLAARDLPLDAADRARLRDLRPRFAGLVDELVSRGIADTVQHDDLHFANVFEKNGRLRVLDWGDACISHPFFSLVVTLQFLVEVSGRDPGDPWLPRLRAAYLEPWGRDLGGVLELALRVGAVAYAIAWARQRDHLPDDEVAEFEGYWGDNLRRAIAQIER
ncbi:MAG TPA: aminoglycoside phosphotransferase family protein [Gaiellaceae bacterium]|nr:aminoglycoside phosphotransferase family protein [Gaiellaceae bacterium]